MPSRQGERHWWRCGWDAAARPPGPSPQTLRVAIKEENKSKFSTLTDFSNSASSMPLNISSPKHAVSRSQAAGTEKAQLSGGGRETGTCRAEAPSWAHDLIQTQTLRPCSERRYVQLPRGGSSLTLFWQMSGLTRCSPYRQRNYIRPHKRKEIPVHAITQTSLEDVMLREISQSRKNEHCMIPLLWDTESSQIQRQKAEGWFARNGKEELGEDCVEDRVPVLQHENSSERI